MNTITLLGRITDQIDLKQTQAGKYVAVFSLAVKRPFTKDVTDFFTIVAWDKQAEVLSKHCGKGDRVCIRGHLTNRSWKDSNGNKRYATEVVASEVSFCEAKNNSEGSDTYQKQNASQGNFEDVSIDEGLPF